MNAPQLIPIGVVAAPLAAPNPVASLGRSLWLYVALTRHVNAAGLVIRRREQLARDLSVAEPEIDAWLDRLRNARLLEVLSSSPFLTVRLLLWSAEGPQASENAVLSGEDKENSNSKHSNAVAISISGSAMAGEGGPGEGDLRAAVAEMLPDAAPAEIDAVLVDLPRKDGHRVYDQ